MKLITLSSFALSLLAMLLTLQGCSTMHPERPHTVYSSTDDNFANADTYRLSAGTYNLKGLHNPKGLARTLEAIDFVDVWAFQEVNASIEGQPEKIAFSEYDLPDRLRNILSSDNWHTFFVPMNKVKGKMEWEGMAIASRFPIQEKGIWPLIATGTKQRAAIYCVISLDDGRQAVIINTDHDVGIFSVTPRDRQRQVNDLSIHIDNSHFKDYPIVLLGDFNTVGYSLMPFRMNAFDEILKLKNAMQAIKMFPLPESTIPFNTFRTFMFSLPLDHIFLHELHCIRWGTTKGYLGSDHRPLWMIAVF